MTTLEKAARAIKAGRGCDADDIHCEFCLWGPDERTKEWDETGCIWLARAAIESLRNPTPDMCIAGGIAIAESMKTAETHVDNAHECWNAMLDAILNEKET